MTIAIARNGREVASVQLTTNLAGDSLGLRAFNVKYVSREVRDFPAPPGPPEGIVGWRVQLADEILRNVAGEDVNPAVPFLPCEFSLHYNGEPPQGINIVPVCISNIDQDSLSPGEGPVFWFGLFDVVGGDYIAPAVAISRTGAVNFAIHVTWFQTGRDVPPFDPLFPP